jgi:tetratricopeptide (TPR) repeat protein
MAQANSSGLTPIEKLVDHRRWLQAEPRLDAYLAIHPRSAHAWMLDGVVEDSLGHLDAGGRAWRKVLELNPSAAAVTDWGNHLVLTGDSDGAERAFQKALQLDPRDGSARFNLVRLLLIDPGCRQRRSDFHADLQGPGPAETGDPPTPKDAAVPECATRAHRLAGGFTAADESAPDVIELTLRADLAARDYSAATAMAVSALRNPRPDPRLLYTLASDLTIWGRPADAVPLLRRTIAALPSPPADLRLQLATAEFYAALPSAEGDFRRLLRDSPKRWEPYYFLGQIAMRAHNPAQATYELIRAQQLAPRQPEIAAALAAVASSQQFWLDAMDQWRLYTKLRPDDAEGWRQLAIAAQMGQAGAVAVSSMQHYLDMAPMDFRSWYLLAIIEKDRGDLADCEKHLHRVLDLESGYAPAWATLGRLALDRQQLAESHDDFAAALRSQPDYAPALVGMAEWQNRAGHPELARPLLRRAVKDGGGAAAWYQLAQTYLRLKDSADAAAARREFERQKAYAASHPAGGRGLLDYVREDVTLTPAERRKHYVEFLETVLAARPRDGAVLCRLGIAEIEAGDETKGMAHLRQAIAATVAYSDALITAAALADQRQPEMAEQFYAIALRTPEAQADARAALGLARLQLAKNNPELALRTLNAVPASATPHGDAADLAALAYVRLHQPKQAVAAFNVALQLDPAQPRFYRDAAVFLGSQEAWIPALQLLDAGVRHCPQSVALALDRAVLLQLSGRRQQAEAALQKLALDPGDPNATPDQRLAAVLLGISEYTTDRKAEAATLFEQLTDADPKLALAWYYRGLIASDAGDRDHALRWVNRSIELNANYAPALYLSGKLLERSDAKLAIERLEAAAKADTAWSAPHYALSQIYAREGQGDAAGRERRLFTDLNARADKQKGPGDDLVGFLSSLSLD